MFYLPRYQEELDSSLPKEEILRRLKIVVKHSPKQSQYHQKLEEPEQEVYLFNGLVSTAGFSMSLVLEKPENFFPIINGSVLESNSGSKTIIEYSLFKSVRLFYAFWVILLSAVAFYFLYQGNGWHWVGLSIIVQLASFFVMLSRFREGVKKSRKELRRLIL